MSFLVKASNPPRRSVAWAIAASIALLSADPCSATAPVEEYECDLVRKSDIMHGDQWQRAIAELGGWLATQTIYTPAEVRRIKVRFNEQVVAMSSYDIEYLLDSIEQKMRLLDTPQARDAKAWLGEYLSAMSDARRAQELRKLPNLLDMDAAQLLAEIQRIDRQRATLQQRQQGVVDRQAVLADRGAAKRQATSEASKAAAARPRSAPSHSPYRNGTGSTPFAGVQLRRPVTFMMGIGM